MFARSGAQRFSVIWIRYHADALKEIHAPNLANIKPLYRDPLNDPKSGFAAKSKEEYGEADYVNGKYSLKIPAKSYRACGNGEYANFACEEIGRASVGKE